MRIRIVVDANVILSALLGGKPSIILFDSRFDFVTTEFTMDEVRKYLPKLSKKLMLDQKELKDSLNQIPLRIYSKLFYQTELKKAEDMISHIDPKDTNILALAIKFETYLWSQDKDFEKANYPKILKTYDFIK